MAKFLDGLKEVVERRPLLLAFALFAGTLAAALSTFGVDRSVPVDRVVKSGSLVVLNLALWIFISYALYFRFGGMTMKILLIEKKFFLYYLCFIIGLTTVFFSRLHGFLFARI